MTWHRQCFSTVVDLPIVRDVSFDDDTFARAIVAILRSLVRRPLRRPARITRQLQGNLCEFCVWELGESRWRLYSKANTWPANAQFPWKNYSAPGIDIIAIDDAADTVFIIEVKSTSQPDADVVSGSKDSLKADFGNLFAQGSPEERIIGCVGEVVSRLGIDGRHELADKVIEAVGPTPAQCEGVRLVGVLVCNGAMAPSVHRKRRSAFNRLHEWLMEQGWRADQCEHRCVELSSLEGWLSTIVAEVTR